MVKNPPANARNVRDAVQSLGQEDPLEKEMATHSSIHSPMDKGAWQATICGVTKSRTRLK